MSRRRLKRLAKPGQNKKRITPALEKAVLGCLKEGMSVNDALKSHVLGRKTLYRHLKENPALKERWDEALEIGNDCIRDEVRRRGMQGVLEPVYHDGVVVGRKRKYSDLLLMFFAKSRMPEFKDTQNELNISFNLEGAAAAFAARVAAVATAKEAQQTIEHDDQ